MNALTLFSSHCKIRRQELHCDSVSASHCQDRCIVTALSPPLTPHTHMSRVSCVRPRPSSVSSRRPRSPVRLPLCCSTSVYCWRGPPPTRPSSTSTRHWSCAVQCCSRERSSCWRSGSRRRRSANPPYNRAHTHMHTLLLFFPNC